MNGVKMLNGLALFFAFSQYTPSPIPQIEAGFYLASSRVHERSEEGTYELKAENGKKYILTLVRASESRVLFSIVDEKILMRKTFFYVEFDAALGRFKADEHLEFGEDGLIPSAFLSIDDKKNAVLELPFADVSMRILKGTRIDAYPALPNGSRSITKRIEAKGQIALPEGKLLKGTLSLLPLGTQTIAMFESEDRLIRREFRLVDQGNGILLTSIWSKTSSFLHLRLALVGDSVLEGYAIVAGRGRGKAVTRFQILE